MNTNEGQLPGGGQAATGLWRAGEGQGVLFIVFLCFLIMYFGFTIGQSREISDGNATLAILGGSFANLHLPGITFGAVLISFNLGYHR